MYVIYVIPHALLVVMTYTCTYVKAKMFFVLVHVFYHQWNYCLYCIPKKDYFSVVKLHIRSLKNCNCKFATHIFVQCRILYE